MKFKRLLDKIRALLPAATGASPVNPTPTTTTEPQILVVDDNEDNRYALTRRLRREGYANLREARDGREALAMLRAEPFDLVLLDVMMPGLDGYEILRRMKADPGLRHTCRCW